MRKLLVIAVLLAPSLALAGESGDYLFAGRGRFSTTVATGVPYIGIAEVAYGVSDRFSVGVIAGVTPYVPGLGLRLRGVLWEGGSTRLILGAPTFYYPETNGLGREPWVLTYPTLRLEIEHKGARLQAGAGVVAAACVDGLLEEIGLGDDPHDPAMEMGFNGGVWNTFLVGGSLPIGGDRYLFADFSVVMKGLRIPSQWVGGPAVVFTLGTTWNL